MPVNIESIERVLPLTFKLSDGTFQVFDGYALLPHGEDCEILHYRGKPTNIVFGRLAQASEIYKAVAEHSGGA